MKLRILRDVHNHKKGEVKDIKEAEAIEQQIKLMAGTIILKKPGLSYLKKLMKTTKV